MVRTDDWRRQNQKQSLCRPKIETTFIAHGTNVKRFKSVTVTMNTTGNVHFELFFISVNFFAISIYCILLVKCVQLMRTCRTTPRNGPFYYELLVKCFQYLAFAVETRYFLCLSSLAFGRTYFLIFSIKIDCVRYI